MRETRDEWPDVFDSSYRFEIRKAATVKDGDDTAITSESLASAEKLKAKGINVRVVNMYAIKPIDREAVIKGTVYERRAIMTCENHSIYGDLGSAVVEVLVEEACVPMLRIGIKNVFNECGTEKELLEKFKMSFSNIMEAVKKLWKERNSM